MGKPAKKKSRVEAKARRKGELQAEDEKRFAFLDGRRKLSSRALSFFEYVKPQLDVIPKWIAYVGTAILVKKVIHESDEFMSRVNELIGKPTGVGITAAPATLLAKQLAPKLFGEPADIGEGMLPEVWEWIISFAIAYIIVEHAGAIISALGDIAGSLSKLVGLFLGAGAFA